MKLYHYKNCNTCRSAMKYLNENGIQVESIDIVESPPSQAELLVMLSEYQGDLRKLFNTSGLVYREMNLKNTLPTMTTEAAITLLSENGKLVKRPFLIDTKRGIVGFKAVEWDAFFNR